MKKQQVILIFSLLLYLLNSIALQAQKTDSTELGFSVGFAPLALLHNGTRLDVEIPISGRSRLVVTPTLYSGLHQGYVDSRNTDLATVIRLNDAATGLLYRYDRISGFGTEVGYKFGLDRNFQGNHEAHFYLAFLAGLHRINLRYQDAGWLPEKDDGLTVLRPGLSLFRDRITRLDLTAALGAKTVIDHFFVDFFLGVVVRRSRLRTDYHEARQHNEWEWLNHAFSGSLFRIGATIGYMSYRQ